MSPFVETMTGMKVILWCSIIVVEAVAAFEVARPAVISALRIAFTRGEVFLPNAAYFMGMLFGDAVRFVIAALLVWSIIWILRKRIYRSGLISN